MARWRNGFIVPATALVALTALPMGVITASSATGRGDVTKEQSWERDVLPAGDGWASEGDGTTGGSTADAEHTVTVRTWAELRAALGGTSARTETTPRLVRVVGTIDANESADTGELLTCDDYADPEYDEDAFRATYDPEVWGTDTDPSGPLEEARLRSVVNQTAQIRQYLPSNVTLVGVGKNAHIVHANFLVRDVTNVIVRNLRISDAYDCFPEWSPGDAGGTWNSEYDNIWVYGANHVWVDHLTLDDGENPPSSLPHVFGAKFEVHDGLLDITNAADLVTVSSTVFGEHDKTNLVGSSNSRITDRGLLRVTFHHNLWVNQGQRLPRVRFGDVHVYNNYYLYQGAKAAELAVYAWGVGVESRIVAEENAFSLAPGMDPADLVADWGGTMMEDRGSLILQPRTRPRYVNLVELHNEKYDPDLGTDAGWDPVLHGRIQPAYAVPGVVLATAGSGRLGR